MGVLSVATTSQPVPAHPYNGHNPELINRNTRRRWLQTSARRNVGSVYYLRYTRVQ